MSRDYRKLRVFQTADRLAMEIYVATKDLPSAERYGLQAQMRRAAVSVASNIVEGSARRTTNEFLNFLNIAAGSAAEARYLADLGRRLGFVTDPNSLKLIRGYTEVVGGLISLMSALSTEPSAQRPT